MWYLSTTIQACKIASLKIAIIAEAHHGLDVHLGYIVDSHDKLLSAAFSAAGFVVITLALCLSKVNSNAAFTQSIVFIVSIK